MRPTHSAYPRVRVAVESLAASAAPIRERLKYAALDLRPIERELQGDARELYLRIQARLGEPRPSATRAPPSHRSPFSRTTRPWTSPATFSTFTIW